MNQGILQVNAQLFSRVDEAQNMFRAGIQHYLRFGPQFMLDLAVFFEYDRLIQQVLNTEFNGTNLIDVISQTAMVDLDSVFFSSNKMHGFGPGIGFKILGAPLASCPQWKLFGGLMASLLYAYQQGNQEHDLIAELSNSSSSMIPNGVLTLPLTLQAQTGRSLVSKFDIDVGVDYSQKFCVDNAKMLLGFTVAYVM